MKLSAAVERHAQAIWLAVLLATLAGVVAALRLPVSLFPHIDYPRVVIAVEAGDREPAQMAADITRPIEVALRGVAGVTRVRSTTSRGSAEVALDFDWGEDMVAATAATEGTLATLLPNLPPGTRFDVRRSDPTIFPVLGIALTSRNLNQTALRQLADLKLRPLLVTVPGVAAVEVLGGTSREVAVDIDPARLAALHLSLNDVAGALAAANSVVGIGRLEDRHRLYLALVENHVATPAEIAAIPVKAGPNPAAGVVTLGQIATITPSQAPNFTAVTSNGRDAVLLNIRQTLTGDSVAIVKAVDARLAGADVPPGVTVTPFYDQSELITGAAHAVRNAILLGALLAGAILFLFLRSRRLMIITGLMLPAVLAVTCLLLLTLHMSFNVMTLGGMAAGVGLVVDDAVVMLEYIVRRMQEGMARGTAGLLAAAAEMGRPLLGSTTATIIVFLPLAFVSGVTGGFFKALAITMVAMLGVSLLYARFVIPLLAAHWMTARDGEAATQASGVMDRLHRAYEMTAARAFARPALTVVLVGMSMAMLGWLAYANVPSGFMPKMDEGGFVLDYKAQPGAALSDTNRLLNQVEQIITATPDVESYSRRTGLQLGGGLTEADEGDYFIRLKDGRRRDIESVMADIRAQVEARVPGLQIETIQLMEDLIGDLTAVPQPIEVKLFGDDEAALEKAAKQVGERIGRIAGVVEVVDGLRVAGDAMVIRIDRGSAAQHGLDPDAAAKQLEALVGGSVATRMRFGEQLVDVRIRAPSDVRRHLGQLGELSLNAPDGHRVMLRDIATIGVLAGQKQLTREDLAPFIGVTARLEGRDLGSAMREVRSAVAGLALPPSVRVDYGGLYAEQRKSFTDLTIVFGAAVLLIALLITFLFEHWRFTIAAIVTALLSSSAVLLGLWIARIELDISALMGLTMVVGMVTELSIFLLAEIDGDRRHDPAAIREAGAARLRPILMSALIAVLALMPLALGLDRGAGLLRPLATAIIFGLTAGVPLVLLFLPAILLMLQAPSRVPKL